MSSPGTLLQDRYRIVRHLGSGAMASVHLADDELLGRQVAIKSVHADPKSEFGRRVLREARMGASLGHPNLVAVFDTIVVDDALLLVMEYVPGTTLADEMRGRMEPERVLQILRPLADALDAVHAGGIVHRDVKPANVLLHQRGDVKLADLGVATSGEASRITRTGGVVGTAAYMAPEQFEQGPVDGSADVYALAAVAFEMLAGRRAFPGADVMSAMAQRTETPPDLRDVVPDTPEAAARALQRGMATKPGDRPITAQALVDELEAAYRPRTAPAVAGPPTAEMPAAAPAEPTPTPPAEPTPTPPAEPAPTPPAEPTPAPPAAPPRTPDPSPRRSAAPIALLGLLLLGGAVLAIVLAASGDDPGDGRAAPPERQTQTQQTAPRTAATQAAPAESELPAATPATPAGAVRAFYERAAEDDLDGAWELAGPGLREQFGGSRSTFDGTFSTLERIAFTRLEQTGGSGDAATVAIATTATHTDRTERCTGEMQAQQASPERWVVARAGVRCRRDS